MQPHETIDFQQNRLRLQPPNIFLCVHGQLFESQGLCFLIYKKGMTTVSTLVCHEKINWDIKHHGEFLSHSHAQENGHCYDYPHRSALKICL